MSKLRVGKIVKGFGKVISGDTTTTSQKRHDVCKVCPHYKQQTDQCGICGCVLTAKTKVPEEACPDNRWEDIKKIPGQDVALRVHDPAKMSIDIKNDKVVITYKDPLIYKGDVEDTMFFFDLINLRGDNDNLPHSEVKLTNIKLKHCSCLAHTIDKSVLKDGEYTRVGFTYNTHLLIEGEEELLSKSVKIVSDQDVFTIKIEGVIKVIN